MRWAARVNLGESGRADSRDVSHGLTRGHDRQGCRFPGRRVVWIVLAGLVWTVQSSVPLAAQAVRVRPPAREPLVAPDYLAAVLHPSEEATTLLSRAREGTDRQDWKLAVDSLQRIIELPGDHILTTTTTKYESARQHAQRQLAALPPDGLRTYRLIYDGEAAAIYRRALEQHDEAALRRLIDRAFLTSYGDDAALTLADWMIDEGRFLEAALMLRLIQDVYPDSNLPAWTVPLRLAVCMAGLQRPDQAGSLLDSLESGKNLPGDALARIRQVREYLGRASGEPSSDVEYGWPMAYGRSWRDGNMSPVEPTFISHLPWKIVLPVPAPKSGIGAMEEYAAGRRLLPAAEITTDGRVIVVKSGANLMGLDRDTFDPLWTTRSEQERSDLVDLDPRDTSFGLQPVPGFMLERQTDDRFASSPQIRRLYHDSVGNQVCLAAGLAVTVEWPGDPPDTLAARRDRIVRRHSMPMAGSAQSNPNFIVAYSLADGRRVWSSDTTAGPHALGPVEFLAAPIAVGNLLLAPGRVNDDLYAVLLDPRTGQIDRHIYLAGTGGAPFDSLYACTPCAADGLVFIPTGRGVLVAVDVAGWSIRWAIRYDQDSAPVNEVGWLPTPVMAAADALLLAPPDADDLFCFDRATGALRWQAPRDNALYVLAAGDGLVWMVGEDVTALDLDSGRQAWTVSCGIPAGRGARSGDRLYLPTQTGLFVLDARTGEFARDRCVDVPPGNLLAYQDALYVSSAFEVRKYPDMNRGYDQAILAHQRQPADMSLAMRLAWLEYLRGHPERALQALSQVPDWVRSQDETRYGRLVHLQVLAMLELAAAPETQREAALTLLRDAQQIARTIEDAITARLALGNFHERSAAEQGLLDACREYAALAFDPTGDHMMSELDDVHEQKAGLMAARRLADLLPKLSAEQTETLMAELQQRLAGAIEARDLRQLQRMSTCAALARLAAQADLALAVSAARELAYEQAEACLQRVIARAASPEILAEALARLAVIHLQPGELHLPASASALLKRLSQEFPAVSIPLDVLEPEWAVPSAPAGAAARTVAAGEAASSLRKRMDERLLAVHQDALAPVALGGPARPPEATAYTKARPVVIRGERTEALADRMLLFVEERTVEARRAEDGELLWPAELRLLGEMQVDSQNRSDGNRFQPSVPPSEPARGLVHGQTLVMNTRFGVHAVGLLTGRRLWSRRFDPPAREAQTTAGSDACVWVHDGYVITVDNYSRLEVARCDAGSDVLWRRRVLDRRWHTVRAFGGYLVAGDAGLQQVDVFSLADGTHLGVCEFVQPADADRAVNIAVLDDAVCGPSSPRQVAAMELKTPGLERWRVELDADLSQIFKPSEQTLAIADRSGRVKLVDPATGKVTLDVQVPACPQGVVDGRIESDVLYVYGLERRPEPQRGAHENQQWAIAAIQVDNGEILWSRADLGPQLCVTGDALTAAPNAIPLLVYRSAAQESRADYGTPTLLPGRRARIELIVLDKATGAALGETVSMDVENADGAAMLLDLQVWPNRVTAFVGANHLRFSLLSPGQAALSPGGSGRAEPGPGS